MPRTRRTKIKPDSVGVMAKNQKKKLQKKQKAEEVTAAGLESRTTRPNPGSGKGEPSATTPADKFCALHETTDQDQTECQYIQATVKRR